MRRGGIQDRSPGKEAAMHDGGRQHEPEQMKGHGRERERGREISPLDGRYRSKTDPLRVYFSEFALMSARCDIELRYLLALDSLDLFPRLPDVERARIEASIGGLGDRQFQRIKQIEARVHHDVKACELFLRETLELSLPNRIHFGLTSEDVNNLAYATLLQRYRDEVQIPTLGKLIERLAEKVDLWKAIPFPAHTHGQAASPTTAGKELAVFLSRLARQEERLAGLRFRGKLGGATGTYGSFKVAAPNVDWPVFAREFVRSLDLEFNPCTTQIEDRDGLAEYFAITSRVNGILLDLDQDLWEYLSRGYLIARTTEGQVGSSTMPHKVNPIRFENSEGNVAVSNALLGMLADKLTHSRMQRDLSDSTVLRNVGVALAHAHLAIEEATAGLETMDLHRERIDAELGHMPQVLAEAYQTAFRVAGVEDPYELLREATQGREVTLETLHSILDRLLDNGDVDARTADRLRTLHPRDYTGDAERLCQEALAEVKRTMDRTRKG